MANDTEFGHASYFYSRDIGRIWRVAEALEYGIVGINERIISTEIAPFGGMKESGMPDCLDLSGPLPIVGVAPFRCGHRRIDFHQKTRQNPCPLARGKARRQ